MWEESIPIIRRRESHSAAMQRCSVIIEGSFGSPHSGAVLLVGARMNVFPVWTYHLAKG